MAEVLRFDNLEQYLLLKNGNYLYKVPFRDSWAVLKVYYGSRNRLKYLKKTVTNVVYSNRSSHMPKNRHKTELDCLHLWREAGFRVFDFYEDVVVEGLPKGGYTLFEYVDAPRFVNYFPDKSCPLEERLELWRRFLPVWHRRHALAIERREPMLLHENGDLKHVMIMDDGQFLFFDFEMVFRSPDRVEEAVGREISAYLRSLCKTLRHDHWELFMQETIDHYPDKDLLDSAYHFLFCHPNPILRGTRFLDRVVKPGSRKMFSKFNVALKLHEMMQK